MNKNLKILFAVIMLTALFFGYLYLFLPGSAYNFERLHIFLFNLCSGGTILLYYTEGKQILSKKAIAFLLLAVGFAISAFLEFYIPAMALSLILAVLVDSVRIRAFSIFPFGFFSKDEPVHRKFHQASLMCLSMGLVISCAVMLNNEYLKLLTLPKLKLDTFFLGFSFPISLITMSAIFSFMRSKNVKNIRILREIGFWNVNLGVIIFFLFIIFEKLIPQVFVTTVLFCTVLMIYYLFFTLGEDIQQKNFLISGIFFLIFTAVTGILYIMYELSPNYSSENYKWLLRLHSLASLYGWNLCGLAVICRFDDFPIRLHSGRTIIFHWFTVILIAPLGHLYQSLAVGAIICYGVILYLILFSKGIDHPAHFREDHR